MSKSDNQPKKTVIQLKIDPKLATDHADIRGQVIGKPGSKYNASQWAEQKMREDLDNGEWAQGSRGGQDFCSR